MEKKKKDGAVLEVDGVVYHEVDASPSIPSDAEIYRWCMSPRVPIETSIACPCCDEPVPLWVGRMTGKGQFMIHPRDAEGRFYGWKCDCGKMEVETDGGGITVTMTPKERE